MSVHRYILGLAKKTSRASQHPDLDSGETTVRDIDELSQQVLAGHREWEADPTPRTPAYDESNAP